MPQKEPEPVTLKLAPDEVVAVSDALRRVYPASILGQQRGFRSALLKVNAAKRAAFHHVEPFESSWREEDAAGGHWRGWRGQGIQLVGAELLESELTHEEAAAMVADYMLKPMHPDNSEKREVRIKPMSPLGGG